VCAEGENFRIIVTCEVDEDGNDVYRIFFGKQRKGWGKPDPAEVQIFELRDTIPEATP